MRPLDQYIARQPILNKQLKLFAYELLYWGPELGFPIEMDAETATTHLLSSTFFTEDIEEITKQYPCFINFPTNLIEKNIPSVFPKERVMIEILETVVPTQKVIEICQSLRKQGYKIALDDFTYRPELIPLLREAEIVKIDFRATTLEERLEIIENIKPFNLTLLAEKVETMAEFEEGKKLGFKYFQGYFFCKPEKTTTIRNFSPSETSLIQLLSEVSSPTTDLEKMNRIISRDSTLSYKLLRFINSAYYYQSHPISSIKHAIAYLGEKELRRFLLFMGISEIAKGKTSELIVMALMRAKFCESMAEFQSWGEKECSEIFLVGLFSLLDVVMDAPMEKILQKLPIAQPVRAALTNGDNSYANYLHLIIALEKNNQQKIKDLCKKLDIQYELLKDCYMLALRYANRVL